MTWSGLSLASAGAGGAYRFTGWPWSGSSLDRLGQRRGSSPRGSRGRRPGMGNCKRRLQLLVRSSDFSVPVLADGRGRGEASGEAPAAGRPRWLTGADPCSASSGNHPQAPPPLTLPKVELLTTFLKLNGLVLRVSHLAPLRVLSITKVERHPLVVRQLWNRKGKGGEVWIGRPGF